MKLFFIASRRRRIRGEQNESSSSESESERERVTAPRRNAFFAFRILAFQLHFFHCLSLSRSPSLFFVLQPQTLHLPLLWPSCAIIYGHSLLSACLFSSLQLDFEHFRRPSFLSLSLFPSFFLFNFASFRHSSVFKKGTNLILKSSGQLSGHTLWMDAFEKLKNLLL